MPRENETTGPEYLKESIPYGSLRPNTLVPVQQTLPQPQTPQQTPPPAPPSTQEK